MYRDLGAEGWPHPSLSPAKPRERDMREVRYPIAFVEQCAYLESREVEQCVVAVLNVDVSASLTRQAG